LNATLFGQLLILSVSNGTTYHYVVSAVNAYGESGHSSERSAMPENAAIVVPVSSITVSSLGGSAISVLGGTLQLQAQVLPSHAAIPSVTWSVYEADGLTATDKAVISGSGLLQAVKDGTVIVTAQAMDGSGVRGSMAITIFGQKPAGLPGDVEAKSHPLSSIGSPLGQPLKDKGSSFILLHNHRIWNNKIEKGDLEIGRGGPFSEKEMDICTCMRRAIGEWAFSRVCCRSFL
jgi:hypothetical protein